MNKVSLYDWRVPRINITSRANLFVCVLDFINKKRAKWLRLEELKFEAKKEKRKKDRLFYE